MVKSSNQKIKLLQIMEILRHDTDDMNPITGEELCLKLNDLGISCDIKTLGRDMKYLNANGFEIMSCQIGRKKAYYIMERCFDIPELKILIDAVQAASFITQPKTDELISKIALLGGKYTSKLLQENIICFNTKKHSNEAIYYNIGTLEEAIRLRKKASFYYFDLSECNEKIYRKDKWRYKVSPLALVFSDDNYYLMTYHRKFNQIVNYRVDRMEQVDIESENLNDEALLRINNLTEYKEQMFLMFNGETTEVKLKFDNSLLNAVHDKFGEKITIERIDENNLITCVKLSASPTFFGWVFQFENKMEILSPENIVHQYEEMKTINKELSI